VQGGTLNASSGTIDVAGTLQTTSGTLSANTVNVSGTFNDSGGTVSVGTLNVLLGGTLSGSGTIVGNVNNSAGTVSPGASPGTLTISGNYVQGPSGVIAMDIGGLAAGTEYDQLLVSGTATLDGTLNTTLINSFAPPAGSSFTFIQAAGGVSGTFATINQPVGALFNSFYGPTTFEFIAAGGGGVVPAPIEPTFNYTVIASDQVLTELTNDLTSPTPEDDILIAPLVETATTTTAEGTVAAKPPACN